MESLKNKIVKIFEFSHLLIVTILLTRCGAAPPLCNIYENFQEKDICTVYPSPVFINNDSIEFKVIIKLPSAIIDKKSDYYLNIYIQKDSTINHSPFVPLKMDFIDRNDGFLYYTKMFSEFFPIKYLNSELDYTIITVRRKNSIESLPNKITQITSRY
jgi:hypothetical protein